MRGSRRSASPPSGRGTTRSSRTSRRPHERPPARVDACRGRHVRTRRRMLFNSLEFALFLPITLLVYHVLIPQRFWRARKGFLVVASYLFYMSWNPFFGILLLGSTLIDFTMGLLLERTSNLV